MASIINSTTNIINDAYDYYLWTLTLSGKELYTLWVFFYIIFFGVFSFIFLPFFILIFAFTFHNVTLAIFVSKYNVCDSHDFFFLQEYLILNKEGVNQS